MLRTLLHGGATPPRLQSPQHPAIISDTAQYKHCTPTVLMKFLQTLLNTNTVHQMSLRNYSRRCSIQTLQTNCPYGISQIAANFIIAMSIGTTTRCLISPDKPTCCPSDVSHACRAITVACLPSHHIQT